MHGTRPRNLSNRYALAHPYYIYYGQLTITPIYVLATHPILDVFPFAFIYLATKAFVKSGTGVRCRMHEETWGEVSIPVKLKSRFCTGHSSSYIKTL